MSYAKKSKSKVTWKCVHKATGIVLGERFDRPFLLDEAISLERANPEVARLMAEKGLVNDENVMPYEMDLNDDDLVIPYEVEVTEEGEGYASAADERAIVRAQAKRDRRARRAPGFSNSSKSVG